MVNNLFKSEQASKKSAAGGSQQIYYYFVDFKEAIDVIKYRMFMLEQRLTPKSSKQQPLTYKCINANCGKEYPLEAADKLMNLQTLQLECTSCRSKVEEKIVQNNDVNTGSLAEIFLENPSFRIIKDLIRQTESMEFPDCKTYTRLQEEKKTVQHTGGGRSGGRGSNRDDSRDDTINVEVIMDGVCEHRHVPGVTHTIFYDEEGKKVIKNETPPWIQSKIQRQKILNAKKNATIDDPMDTRPDVETMRQENNKAMKKYLSGFFHELVEQQNLSENGEEKFET